MSNVLREVVELTAVRGFVKKGLLLHIADTMRDDDPRFWRSKRNVALRLGTDEKTVRRNLALLMQDGVVICDGEKKLATSHVDIYRLGLDALLSLDAIELPDRRPELLSRLPNPGWGSQPQGERLKAAGAGVRSPPNHTYPCSTHDLPRKETNTEMSKQARSIASLDHLRDDEGFARFMANVAQRG